MSEQNELSGSAGNPLTVPASLPAFFETINNSQALDEIDVSARIKAHLPSNENLDANKRQACWAESAAFDFYPAEQPTQWGTYFAPLASGRAKTGEEVFFPDPKLIDKATIDYWAHRAASVSHPVMKARYADLAWDFGNQLRITKPDHKMAIMAAEAYLDAVEKGVAHNDHQAWDYLDRTFQIGLTLKNIELVARAKVELFKHFQQRLDSSERFRWWEIDNILEKYKNIPITEEDLQVILSGYERLLANVTATESEQFDPHMAEAIADRLAGHYKKRGKRADEVRVIKTSGSAFEYAASKAAALTAVAWLEQTLHRYRAHQLNDDAARLERAVRGRNEDVRSEMVKISTPVEFSRQEFEDWLNGIVRGDLTEGLLRIGLEFLTREKSTREFLTELAKTAPLMSMVAIDIKGHDGMTVATVGSLEEDADGRLVHQISQRLGLEAGWLDATFDLFKTKHSPTASDFVEFLKKSPCVTDDDLELLGEGFEAWLTGDNIKAIHILVPRMESMLRNLLSLMGGNTTRPTARGGGFEALGMGAILHSAHFRNYLPSDLRWHLLGLYTDPRGMNLRNNIAHGSIPGRAITRPLANWVVHSFLCLGGLKINSDRLL